MVLMDYDEQELSLMDKQPSAIRRAPQILEAFYRYIVIPICTPLLFSSDSDADMEAMIQSAINMQLKTICFTEHLIWTIPVIRLNSRLTLNLMKSDFSIKG